MFIEASDQTNNPRRQNDRAGLVTTNVLQPGSYCFNFWYVGNILVFLIHR